MTTWNTNIPQATDFSTVVDSASVNNPVNFLASRDQYLFDQLNSYSDKTILLGYNQAFIATGELPAGTPVYFDTSTGAPILNRARATYDGSTDAAHLTPNKSAYVYGIVKQVYAGSTNVSRYGDVYVYGLIPAISLAALMDSDSGGGEPSPGPLYLSSKEAGKYSSSAQGTPVFVGYVISNTTNNDLTTSSALFLAPNIDSLNQLYSNYKVWLSATTAGTAVQNVDTTWTVSHTSLATDIATKIGWITAADATSELGITPPTGAQFYYNLPPANYLTLGNGFTQAQITNALKTKAALPPWPGAYTMLFANGVLQNHYSSDFTAGVYIINQDGIWWTTNADGYQPFNRVIDSQPLVLHLYVTKLNPNFAETLVTSLSSNSGALAVTDAATGFPAVTGNLNLTLTPAIVTSSGVSSGVAMGGLAFDTPSQTFQVSTVPVVNAVTTGPGISASSSSGNVLLSLTSSLSGEVSDIEPEEAAYVYKGLHSYLRIIRPLVNQRVGFVGKLKLPDALPAAGNLNLKLMLFGENGVPAENPVTFVFECSVSKISGAVGAAVASSVVSVENNTTTNRFLNNTITEVYKTAAVTPVPYFQIPAAVLAPGGYVNFRIARTSSSTVVGGTPIGVIGVSWVVE